MKNIIENQTRFIMEGYYDSGQNYFFRWTVAWTSFFILCIFIAIYLKEWYRKVRYLIKCSEALPGPKYVNVMYFNFMKNLYFSNVMSTSTAILYLILGVTYAGDLEKFRICRVWVFLRPFIFLYKPETVEVLLSSPVVIDKSQEYSLIHPWIGRGLLTSSGDKWHARRKMLTPAFHFRILEEFIPVFNEESMVLVRKLLKEAAQKPCVDIVPLMAMLTLDVICETAMGVRIHAQSGGAAEYVKAVSELGQTLLYRLVRPWLWLNWMHYCFPSGWKFLKNLKHVHGFTRKVIKEKKQFLLNQRRKSNVPDESDSVTSSIKTRKAFLELMLEHHLQDESFTEEDIREEVDTFMLEGHDTTAMSLSWTLYNVGLLPDVQDNLIREIDSIFGTDTERPVTTEDLREMKYTECVIKEALRLHPSVPFFAREVNEDIKILDYTIAPGSLCVVSPFILHRNAEVFPNPEKFDPERFFPENSVGRHPYAYVPFSGGPRNCIGQKFAMLEEKTVIANIFRNMKVQSLDHRDKINFIPDIVLRNSVPLRLKITPRSREQ